MVETPQTSKKRPVGQPSTTIYAAQCGECFKWRVISTKEEFEDMRSRFIEDPFICPKKANVSCEDPADINYDDTRIWAIDKPNIPKPPEGFERELVLRRDLSKMDTSYTLPSGKKVRNPSAIASFLEANPEYGDLSVSDFSFIPPKLMDDTIRDGARRKGLASGNKRSKKALKEEDSDG